jgi:hypothetical protein
LTKNTVFPELQHYPSTACNEKAKSSVGIARCAVKHFDSANRRFCRDGRDPSHGTGESAKNINVYALWDDGTAPEGGGWGCLRLLPAFRSFKPIQRNSNQSKSVCKPRLLATLTRLPLLV